MAQATGTQAREEVAMPVGGRLMAGVMLAVAAVTALYWIVWLVIPGGRDVLAVLPTDQAYIRFENAFPAADGWMALAAAASAVQILRGKSSAIMWMFAAGGAGIYLGGMDVLYDLENGIYGLLAQNPGSVSTEMAINVATLGISAWVMWWANKHRDWMCRA